MKNITFITTGQPTTNPRLVKEAETLSKLGYNVKVICCYYQAWAQPFDEEIIAKNPTRYIYCGGDPVTHKSKYFKTRLRKKICQLLSKYTKAFNVAENAISRTHTEAVSIAKKIKTDIYIAHNLGALPAAVIAAKYNNAKAGYDAEDMHSAQFTSDNNAGYLLNKYIEEKYFKQTAYFTAASPLIATNYAAAYKYLNPVVINNVFPKTHLDIKQNYMAGKPLKIFWFSQTIGADRGLESVIKAMPYINSNTELHLLGNCSADDKEAFLSLIKNKSQLHFHEPVPADELFNFASQFDIGLATETGIPLNRDICLTNKIFTYVQCGLAIIASDTQAQTLFMQQYPATGKLYNKTDEQSLVSSISDYTNHPDLLYQTRLNNYALGQTELNWETESIKFLNLINTIE